MMKEHIDRTGHGRHLEYRVFLVFLGCLMLLGCTKEDAAEAPQHELSVALSASALPFTDTADTDETRGIRRAWSAPSGYSLYPALYGGTVFKNTVDLTRSAIDVYLTHDGAVTTPCPLHGRLRYSPAPPPSISQWKMVLPNDVDEKKDVKPGDYYAYGFVPRDAADNATIEKLPESSNWADGAVLTIHGLKAVATDPCVIIGAKEGPDADHDNGLVAGDFQFHLNTGTTEGVTNPNYLYFLFDHLFSALSISMRVDGDYHALRRITLKELYMKTRTISGTVPEKTDVTITLGKTDDGTSPIQSITYTPTPGTEKSDSTVYRSADGIGLDTNYSSFLGHFMPSGVSELILTSVYDVYDTNDNLIRKNCRATNTLLLSELFDRQTESVRGWKYDVNITIKPTFLYVLSDPDLDSPSMEVEM